MKINKKRIDRMKQTKKYFFFPCAIGLCTVCAFALLGCQTGQNERPYYNGAYYDQLSTENGVQQDTTIETSDQSMVQASIPIVYENATVINPYQTQKQVNVTVETNLTSTCSLVQNGQVIAPPTQRTVSCTQEKEKKDCTCQQKQLQNTQACNCVNKQSMPVSNSPCQSDSKEQIEKSTSHVNSTVVNIETPARCQIALHNNQITSSIPLNKASFKMVNMDKSDALPRYEVNNYTFKDMPLDLAIQNLVSEAGIRVYSDDALFPDVSGDSIRGELTTVINELTSAGDVFYRYNASQKQLILSRWARFVMHVPGGRVGMYTVLDALRGANITNLQPDFGANEIYMRVNSEKLKTINELLETIKQSSSLLLFDIQVYRLTKTNPNQKLDWQNIVQNFGVTRINSSVNGIMGRVLSMKHQPNSKNIVDMLKGYGSVNVISEGVAVMPNNWKVRFDIGQCVKFETPEKDLSMLFQSSILSGNRAESNIALDTPSGEITSFHAIYNIDDMLNVIGIPGKIFNPAWEDNIEYIITLKPRIVRLIK